MLAPAASDQILRFAAHVRHEQRRPARRDAARKADLHPHAAVNRDVTAGPGRQAEGIGVGIDEEDGDVRRAGDLRSLRHDMVEHAEEIQFSHDGTTGPQHGLQFSLPPYGRRMGASVLNGDGGVVGKESEEPSILLGKGRGRLAGPINRDDAEEAVTVQKRLGDYGRDLRFREDTRVGHAGMPIIVDDHPHARLCHGADHSFPWRISDCAHPLAEAVPRLRGQRASLLIPERDGAGVSAQERNGAPRDQLQKGGEVVFAHHLRTHSLYRLEAQPLPVQRFLRTPAPALRPMHTCAPGHDRAKAREPPHSACRPCPFLRNPASVPPCRVRCPRHVRHPAPDQHAPNDDQPDRDGDPDGTSDGAPHDVAQGRH